MATMEAPALPSKKRKSSAGSNSLESDNINRSSVSTVLAESRLPSKKRKGSHDSSVCFADDSVKRRSCSHDSSTGEEIRRRKWSDQSMRGDDSLLPAADAPPMKPPEPLPALEHLDALGATSTGVAAKPRKESNADENSSMASSGQGLLLEAIMMTTGSQAGDVKPPAAAATAASSATAAAATAANTAAESFSGRRDRLESWGGMSDLSLPVEALLHHSMEDQDGKPGAIPCRISLDRDRLNSVTSFERERLNSVASLSETSPPHVMDGAVGEDIQAFVAAAMASVGDQLAELAGAVESAASADDTAADAAPESENSSTVSPIIGAVTDHGRRGRRTRPRSWSTSSGKISVDYEAVAAAVDAAQAATGALDLTSIGNMAPPPVGSVMGDKKRSSRRQLPLSRHRGESTGSEGSQRPIHAPVTMSKYEKDCNHNRSRAPAGYKAPPSKKTKGVTKSLPPIKKRAKRNSPEPDKDQSPSSLMATPRVSNKSVRLTSKDPPPVAPLVMSSDVSIKPTKGQASQKWDNMYDCLIAYVDERRTEQTKQMTEAEKAEWEWDGNVPTTFKTKDGKALGRWVNNQRSAKSKGTLKEEREQRLIDAGLKWSVLASNSWNEMLEELRFYIEDLKKRGKKWDGNVPTTYQIKPRAGNRFLQGEDKNLGRWVNRQRSLFQAGKLRKDRQQSLEKLGLKWQILATTTWDNMHDTLLEYVESRRKDGGTWDGNVPANYRTNDDPPRALGRWINRQRSAYVKGKLKQEYVDKLNSVGLKWSVHERNLDRSSADDKDETEDAAKSVGTSEEQNNKSKEENSSGKANETAEV